MDIYINQYKLFNTNMNLLDYVIYNKIMVYDKITDSSILLNSKNINYMDLEFYYDENNYRIPYYNKEKIICISIINDDEINYISSMTLIPDHKIIFGENIQLLADIVVGSLSSLQFNPNNRYCSKKISLIENLKDIKEYKIIFVFTHDLELFYNKFENNINDKIIISHNSDHEITYIKNVKMHLGQNNLIRHDNLLPIPIGIENRHWFNHNIFHEVRQMKIKKTKDIYFFFNLNTHPSRKVCFNILKKELEWNNMKNKQDYFIELAKHKYAICPRGNGIDTHRIWECLYLDVIPIVIEPDFPNIDNLPIIVLKDWDQISLRKDIFPTSYKNQYIDKLSMDYYKNIIIKMIN
jgi:hypothetical protein